MSVLVALSSVAVILFLVSQRPAAENALSFGPVWRVASGWAQIAVMLQGLRLRAAGSSDSFVESLGGVSKGFSPSGVAAQCAYAMNVYDQLWLALSLPLVLVLLSPAVGAAGRVLSVKGAAGQVAAMECVYAHSAKLRDRRRMLQQLESSHSRRRESAASGIGQCSSMAGATSPNAAAAADQYATRVIRAHDSLTDSHTADAVSHEVHRDASLASMTPDSLSLPRSARSISGVSGRDETLPLGPPRDITHGPEISLGYNNEPNISQASIQWSGDGSPGAASVGGGLAGFGGMYSPVAGSARHGEEGRL